MYEHGWYRHGPRGRRPGRGHQWGPWAHGMGGGPPWMRGGRRGGSRAARGDVRLAVLALLAEQPRHGYEIIQEIVERSSGVWRPSPGSVYPTLAQLEDEGLVRTEHEEGRRVMHLTEQGVRYTDEHAAELAAVFDAVTGSVDDDLVELGQVGQQVAAAVAQVAQAGTKAQLDAAAAVLVETRRRLYRILAEDDQPNT